MKSLSLDNLVSYGIEPPSIDDGDDSAPEEIGFEKSKKVARKVEKEVIEFIQTQNKSLKKKRKNIHERNTVQKQAKNLKLKELEKKKLPKDFLEIIGNLPTRIQTVSSKGKNHIHFPDEVFNGNDTDFDNELQLNSKNNGPEDFISLHGTTKFAIVPLKTKAKQPNSAVALEFKKRFSGGKDIQRETVGEMISKSKKQSLNKRFKVNDNRFSRC